MHSLVQIEFGKPGKVLQITERPLPEPDRGQARVKLVLSPIHNHDLATINGTYGSLPDLPYVPGTEAVGVVDKLGEGVTNLAVGQRVAGGATGAWAEYYLIDASRAITVLDTIADETAAQLISMPLSARLLLEKMDVKPGDWIIQNTANGAVGKMLAGFGADMGINVVGAARRGRQGTRRSGHCQCGFERDRGVAG